MNFILIIFVFSVHCDVGYKYYETPCIYIYIFTNMHMCVCMNAAYKEKKSIIRTVFQFFRYTRPLFNLYYFRKHSCTNTHTHTHTTYISARERVNSSFLYFFLHSYQYSCSHICFVVSL